MKMFVVMILAALLSACQATMVSVHADGKKTECSPVVSVHSLGSSVTVTDGSDCKAATE